MKLSTIQTLDLLIEFQQELFKELVQLEALIQQDNNLPLDSSLLQGNLLQEQEGILHTIIRLQLADIPQILLETEIFNISQTIE